MRGHEAGLFGVSGAMNIRDEIDQIDRIDQKDSPPERRSMKQVLDYGTRSFRFLVVRDLVVLVASGMNTEGETPNRAARWAIWRTFRSRLPDKISDSTPWLPISGRSDCASS